MSWLCLIKLYTNTFPRISISAKSSTLLYPSHLFMTLLKRTIINFHFNGYDWSVVINKIVCNGFYDLRILYPYQQPSFIMRLDSSNLTITSYFVHYMSNCKAYSFWKCKPSHRIDTYLR